MESAADHREPIIIRDLLKKRASQDLTGELVTLKVTPPCGRLSPNQDEWI